MSEFKGTPGPWSLDDFDNVVHGEAPSHRSGRKETVRVSGVALPGRVTKEYAANTRLVAAAPELLEALQQLLADSEFDQVALDAEYGCRKLDEIEKDGDLPASIVTARKAIAKALGETK